ncbi:uncharacterized protein TNCV_3281451 [Trichonephila clavipes]|nr:uncharacterized protein TNCV_3281451 [Trichonephila clavipes]
MLSGPWVAWWLDHRTPDRKAWWVELRVQGTGEYSPPLQFHGRFVEDDVGGVAIYRSFGEFRRANSYCYLYGAQGLDQRQAYFQPLATMNFVHLF